MQAGSGGSTIRRVVLIKLIGIFVFMIACLVGALWVTLELAGALAEGTGWVWYLALALALIPTILFAILTVRSRSRGAVLLTVAAGALLVSILLTYPSGNVACGPTQEVTPVVDVSAEDLEGLVEEDTGAGAGSTAAAVTGCP